MLANRIVSCDHLIGLVLGSGVATTLKVIRFRMWSSLLHWPKKKLFPNLCPGLGLPSALPIHMPNIIPMKIKGELLEGWGCLQLSVSPSPTVEHGTTSTKISQVLA